MPTGNNKWLNIWWDNWDNFFMMVCSYIHTLSRSTKTNNKIYLIYRKGSTCSWYIVTVITVSFENSYNQHNKFIRLEELKKLLFSWNGSRQNLLIVDS